jgi:tetratricopeptide (TPR) repeat protein
MGFFDWLLGKQQKAPSRPPRPKVLAGLDDDSRQLLIDTGNGVVTVMDREMFDYMYGESSAPDPAQRHLDELLPNVTRVRAVASGMYRGRATGCEIVLDTSDPVAIAAFRNILRIVEDPSTFSHCACLGGPTLELFSGQDLIATIGLQHGHSIRWAKWKHDARLRHGQALNDWLTKHGIDLELLDVLLHNQYDVGGMMPLGFQRSGSSPLSRAEQQVRLAEISRVRGGDLDGALARCQKVIDENPKQAFAYAVRGLIRQKQNNLAGCVADYSEAIRLGLGEAEVFFARAVAYDNLGRPREALVDCTTALDIDPKHVNALNSRGLIHCKLGMLHEAIADLNEAIQLAPKWGLPYLNRAQVHIQREDLDAGIADYNRVIEQVGQSQAPDDRALAGIAFWNRGRCYRMRGNQAQAEADIREAVRLNPNLSDAAAGSA